MTDDLTYPNGLTASWTYGNRGELLEVDNALSDGSVSKYVYTYDAAGRRIGCDKSGSAFTTPDTYAYLYNVRSELTNATAEVDAAYRYGYDFDDIGNRRSSVERRTQSAEYTANNLNQYTAVDAFVPQYDADGNQTLVKTATGVWQVTYNGENRPILWTHLVDESNNQTNQTISMSFDRMGRRVTKNGQRFVYNGYLQVANYHLSSTNYHLFVWDPTEPVATRPLVWTKNDISSYYAFDGNKNVSEVLAADGSLAAHYEYAPFGALTVSRGASAATNPFRFSSEYAEDDTATVYYNYRHYEPVMGRWLGRDPIGESGGRGVYLFVTNVPVLYADRIGLDVLCANHEKSGVDLTGKQLPDATAPIEAGKDSKGKKIYAAGRVVPSDLSIRLCCECQKGPGGRYKFVAEVKASYTMQIVKVGVYGVVPGYGPRTQDGYDRTVEHEKLHIANMKATMDKIFETLMKGRTGTFTRTECDDKRKAARSKLVDVKGDWDIMKMNESAHSGDLWEEWKKNGGKTESSPELW